MLICLLIWWSFTEKLLQYCSTSAVMQHCCEVQARKCNNLLKTEMWSDLPRMEWKRGDGMFWMQGLLLDSLQTHLSWRKGPDTCRIGNLSSLSLPSEPMETSPCEICTSGRLEVFGGKRIWQTVRRKLFTRNWWIGISPLALGCVVGNWGLAELCFWNKRGMWKAACIAEEGRNKCMYFPAFSHRSLGSPALRDHLAASAKTKGSKYLAPQGESAIGMNQVRAVGSKGRFYHVCGAVEAER